MSRVRVCVGTNYGVLQGILDGSFKVALTSANLKFVNLICEHFHYRHFGFTFSMIYLEFSQTILCEEQCLCYISYVGLLGMSLRS